MSQVKKRICFLNGSETDRIQAIVSEVVILPWQLVTLREHYLWTQAIYPTNSFNCSGFNNPAQAFSLVFIYTKAGQCLNSIVINYEYIQS